MPLFVPGRVEVADDDLDDLSVDRMEVDFDVGFCFLLDGDCCIMQRADKMSRSMDQTQYIEFSECRQVNFRMSDLCSVF